jgi:hypothetical protein
MPDLAQAGDLTFAPPPMPARTATLINGVRAIETAWRAWGGIQLMPGLGAASAQRGAAAELCGTLDRYTPAHAASTGALYLDPKSMQPKQRVEAYLHYMESRGVPRRNVAPPLWTALWARGIFLPPPPFLALPALIALSAVLGALLVLVLWLVFGFMALFKPHPHPPTLPMLWWAAPITAAFIAVANPIYYRRMARQHGLATWSTFAGVRQRAC